MQAGKSLILVFALVFTVTVWSIDAPLAKIVKHIVFLDNNNLRLQAKAKLKLSAEMLKALDHNINLTFVWQVKIKKNRSWWYIWDKELYDRELTRRIFLNRVQNMYALHNPDSGKTRHYRSLEEAINVLASIDVIYVVPDASLKTGELYTSQVRFELKNTSLPALMYLKGLFAKDWNFDSGWHIKPFNL